MKTLKGISLGDMYKKSECLYPQEIVLYSHWSTAEFRLMAFWGCYRQLLNWKASKSIAGHIRELLIFQIQRWL
jgi:hypothetical protein